MNDELNKAANDPNLEQPSELVEVPGSAGPVPEPPPDSQCIGCTGLGWVQVIDPARYLYMQDGGTGAGLPCITPAMARAVICPVCQGTGKQK